MTQIKAAPRGTPTQYTAVIPSSPIVIDAPDGNVRLEWRHFLQQLWLRTGGSVATAPGTITGVTAGHGLSGGGTVGTVTLVLQIPVAIGDGGTGATTAAQALLNLGAAPLASPTFTGTVTIPAGASIAGYAPLASPAFTGTPSMPTGSTAVTQAAGNNSTALATTAYADNLNALVWG